MSAGTNAFHLATLSIAGCQPFAAIVRNGQALAIAAVNGWAETIGGRVHGDATLLDFIQEWDDNLAVVTRFLQQASAASTPLWTPLERFRLHAPIRPRQILCTGANYRQHVLDHAADFGGGVNDGGTTAEQRREEARRRIDERSKHGTPYAFAKLPSAVIGPFDPITLPHDIEKPDWELELAVVIGKRARHVRREDAMRHVAGYTIANDVTARDRLYRPDMRTIASDWLSSKSPPGFLPLGPFIAPARDIADPSALRLTLSLNGQPMQDAMASDMIFDIARQIEYISNRVELLPGDLILTGSPAGNGTHSGRFLQPGDELVGAITGLGTQRNTCTREAASAL